MTARPEFGVKQHIDNSVTNAEITQYTVPADRYLYLTHFTFRANAGGTGRGILYITDEADVTQWRIMDAYIQLNATYNMFSNIIPRFFMPNGWKVKLVSTVVGLEISASLLGYSFKETSL